MTSVYPLAGTATPGDATLWIEPWLDPVVDEVGHDPRSAYVETYWLPVLGPSTTWLLRRFASRLDEMPAGAEVDLEDLARSLGLGERFGANAPFARTVKRCVDFEMAHRLERGLAVRRRLPPLSGRHLRRLPASLQDRHARETAVRPDTVSERMRRHGCRLALSLLDFGEDRSAAEQQLVRWGFDQILASQCADWAALEQARRRAARLAHPSAERLLPAGSGAANGAAGGTGSSAGGGADVAARSEGRLLTRLVTPDEA